MNRLSLCSAALLTAAGMAVAHGALRESSDRQARPQTVDEMAGPVEVLQKKLAQGKAKLEFEPAHGYLASLLKLLQVPVSSQTLVFSKTSFQRPLISPQTPRALYFNDDVYLGWVPKGDVIEVSEASPRQGAVFYALSQLEHTPPTFARRAECMQCHDGLKTMGGPGHLMGSTLTALDGQPLFQVERYLGGHRSPLSVRWGGWYVTGTHAGDVHLGNAFLADKTHPEEMDLAAGANLTDLRARIDTSPYLSPHSDIVALLVLEHQVRMHNLIARANREVREVIGEQAAARTGTNRTAGLVAESTRQCIGRVSEALLEYMLFRDEAALNGPVKGTSTFAQEFQQRGPFDSKGRSLRQLDLNQRLLRFPCSYLIYSEAFDSLPQEARSYLWKRLRDILSGQDQSATYAGMKRADRESVLAILVETKPEFAAWIKEH
jgi:hypothetical protein